MSTAIQKAKTTASHLRAKLKARGMEAKVGLALAGVGLGNLQKRGTIPVTIMGLPAKPMLAVVAGFVEANSSGTMQRIASAVADASIATYFYEVGKQGTLIAGEYDDDPQGDAEV